MGLFFLLLTPALRWRKETNLARNSMDIKFGRCRYLFMVKEHFFWNTLIIQIWNSVFSFNISVLESASAWNLEEVKFESLIELALGKSSSGVEVDLELKWSFSGCKKS